jgi:hypothetical protein
MPEYHVYLEDGRKKCTKMEAMIYQKYGFEIEVIWILEDFNFDPQLDSELVAALC